MNRHSIFEGGVLLALLSPVWLFGLGEAVDPLVVIIGDSIVVKESEPSIGRAPEAKESAPEPKVTHAPAEKMEHAATTEPRTKRRGVMVVAKREEPAQKLEAGDDASASKPEAQIKMSKPTRPVKTIATRTERRGVVVLTKREEPNKLAGDASASSQKPRVWKGFPDRRSETSKITSLSSSPVLSFPGGPNLTTFMRCGESV